VRAGRGWPSAFALFAAVAVVALAACAGAQPAASEVPAIRTPSLATPSLAAPVGEASPGPLVVDPGLLAVLPTRLAGFALMPVPATAAGLITDTTLQATAAAVAVASVVAPGGSRGDDLAIATVVRLRPGVYSDAFYGRWRADYDAAACQPAGGVSGHRQQSIGQHAVEITDCVQGAKTDHTYLGDDLLVSITTVGARGFGDLVIAGLRR
jgi:hypothetical protein